ncbi:site-specific integrase [Pseudomonadota bacterium]
MFIQEVTSKLRQFVVPKKKQFFEPKCAGHKSLALNAYFTPKSQKTGKSYTVAEIAQQFMEITKDQKALSPKTLRQYEQYLQLFQDIWGLDDPNEMDRENAELILGLLYKQPKNPEKNPKLKGYKGIELIKRNEEIDGEVISRRTVKKIINFLSTFFNWAESRGYVEKNHFYKLRVRKALTTDRRYQFTCDELLRIFTMRDYEKGTFPYYYWLPLLLRFTGARLNELCQLTKDDLKQLDGYWGIRICALSPGQRVKNENSERFVPLHTALINRGFVEFVASRPSQRIFDELKLVNGYYSATASKWFARRRAQLGFKRGKDAYSFRHRTVDELKQKGVALEVIQELVGHSSNTITSSVYSRKYRPQTLFSAISKIDDSHVRSIQPYTAYSA